MPEPAITRPLLHFTPAQGWMNDPNGMVYHDGLYHLAYQHHPGSTVWGPMHWGHAVSRNLLDWQHLPLALAPDQHGAMFSGSSVVDEANTAGFGAGALVAIFTQDAPGRQAQSLAYSTDAGQTWTVYAGNPVVLPPPGQVDFRDPKVFWYQGSCGGHWAMLLAVRDQIWFLRSNNLREWQHVSAFMGYGSVAGVWECPELVELPIEGEAASRWMLVVSVQKGAPAGGNGVQYFLGSFDGERFVCDDPPARVRWADYGADFYAAQAWNDAPNQRRIWLAWMNNWQYANQVPATTWRGAMSLPRDLALVRDADGLHLRQQPVAELHQHRQPVLALTDKQLETGTNPLAGIDCLVYELVLEIEAATFMLQLRANDTYRTILHYDAAAATLLLDRTHSGLPIPNASAPQPVPLAARNRRIDLRIIVDHGSIEVFADGGRVCLTAQIFPPADADGLALVGAGRVHALQVWRLAANERP